MRYWAATILFAQYAVLSACSSSDDFHPSNAEIAKVEAALQGHHCIGDLDGWRRAYARTPIFSPAEVEAARESRFEGPKNFDKRMIEFRLERADGRSIVPGRRRPESYDDFDLHGECASPDCLGGGYMTQRDELFIECEKRSAP